MPGMLGEVATVPIGIEPTELQDPIKGAGTSRAPMKENGIRALLSKAKQCAPDGEGHLVLVLAPPRHGKTHLAERWRAQQLAAGDLTFIHDPKIPRQYEGILCADTSPRELLRERPPKNTARCFTSATRPDDIFFAGRMIARGEYPPIPRTRTSILIDEAMRALKARQTWAGENGLLVYTEGSSQGVSMLLCSQIPQRVPGDAFDFSQSIILGRYDGKTLNYLQDIQRWRNGEEEIVKNLKVGQWLIFTRFDSWDGIVYGPHD